MNTKTIEQKAAAYDKALSRAREIHRNEDEKRRDMEWLFSELKESEDEQFKKWILEYLYDGMRKCEDQFRGQFKTAIAWLERHGEMVSDPRCHIFDELLVADDIYHMAINDEMVQKAKSKAIDALSKLEIYKLLNIEKQGEQKPVEWSEEDKRNFELVIDCVCTFYPDPVQKHKLTTWLKSLWIEGLTKEQLDALKYAHQNTNPSLSDES